MSIELWNCTQNELKQRIHYLPGYSYWDVAHATTSLLNSSSSSNCSAFITGAHYWTEHIVMFVTRKWHFVWTSWYAICEACVISPSLKILNKLILFKNLLTLISIYITLSFFCFIIRCYNFKRLGVLNCTLPFVFTPSLLVIKVDQGFVCVCVCMHAYACVHTHTQKYILLQPFHSKTLCCKLWFDTCAWSTSFSVCVCFFIQVESISYRSVV
jgi:hypothetical protein